MVCATCLAAVRGCGYRPSVARPATGFMAVTQSVGLLCSLGPWSALLVGRFGQSWVQQPALPAAGHPAPGPESWQRPHLQPQTPAERIGPQPRSQAGNQHDASWPMRFRLIPALMWFVKLCWAWGRRAGQRCRLSGERPGQPSSTRLNEDHLRWRKGHLELRSNNHPTLSPGDEG